MLDPNVTLDKIFKRICIPVLLTYDSNTVKNYEELKEAYRTTLEDEILEHKDSFFTSNLPDELKIHLILLPLQSKKELIDAFHERLKAWQNV